MKYELKKALETNISRAFLMNQVPKVTTNNHLLVLPFVGFLIPDQQLSQHLQSLPFHSRLLPIMLDFYYSSPQEKQL